MHRIYIYRAEGLRQDAEAIEAIAAAAGIDAAEVASRLASGAARFDDLEEAKAREVAAALGDRGVEVDVESMALEPAIGEWLRIEVPKWVRRGLLHPGSVPRIFGNYGLELPEVAPPPALRKRELASGTLLRAVLTLGAVLIGLGLILFIAANWQKIPDQVKIGGALALTLVALHVGYRFRFGEPAHPRLGGALFLIALFGIGCVVILIAQIYHVAADSYLLPLIWGLLGVPLALLLRFRPALYVASGLWFWSYWLHAQGQQVLPWFYPALLIGFLLPWSLLSRDRTLHLTHLGVLMLALLTTLVADDFWQATVYVAALVLLRIKVHKPLYDWLILVGFFLWGFAFLQRFDDLPNVFYALPLGYLLYRAWASRSNALMIANTLNAQFWVSLLLLQVTERFALSGPAPTGILMFLVFSGVLWLGIGKRLESSETWPQLSGFLRFAGAALAGVMLYALSFRFYDRESAFYDSPLFLAATLLVGGVGLALAAPPIFARAARPPGGLGEALVLGLTAASLVLSLLMPPSHLLHSLLFNVILFIGALSMMLRGHREQSLGWYNGGIALFVVLIASRYFDTFVEYLPRSIFFVLGGVFLIAWAVLVERLRRRNA